MHPFRLHTTALAVALAFPLATSPSRAADAASVAAPPVSQLDKVEVTGTRARLDAARNGLSPDTGSSIYRFDRQDIAKLPLGDSTPLNQVVLQAPGVVQDSYGQLHVRGDHANVQYRINGVIIPEAISGFGQSLQTRFANRISVLTGAIPAQYGYRTAAVVDIQTKGDDLAPGATLSITAGSRGHLETEAELSGTRGAFSYYLTGSSLRNDIGIENPTPARNAIHDETTQRKGFGYLSYLLGDDSRVSVMFGVTDNRFQIPNLPGEPPAYTLAGAAPVDSTQLDANQQERNRYGVLSYQGTVGERIDYQVSLAQRTTDVHYRPDPVGDLTYNGIAADVLRRNDATSLQGDLSWRFDAAHTLRAGVFAQRETFQVANQATVFPADADGNATSDVPLQIVDDSRIRGRLWGVYLQDEWQPTQQLTVNYGVRYDQVRTVVDERQWSPRLGVVYDVSKTLRVHAGYARYFTPPPTEKIDTTSVQAFLGTTNALPSDANTAVKSERSNYLDAGLSWQASDQLTLGVDGYYRRVRHLQDEGQFGNALIYSAFNYAQGKVYGLEFSANYRAGGLSAYGNLALSRAMGKQVETGQFNFAQAELDTIASQWVHLDHDQTVSVSSGISYRWADSLTLSADALYGSGLRKGYVNSEHLPSYASVNLAAARSVDLGAGFGKLDLRLALINAFDRVYPLRDGSGIGVGAPQFGLRRTLYVGASKTF